MLVQHSAVHCPLYAKTSQGTPFSNRPLSSNSTLWQNSPFCRPLTLRYHDFLMNVEISTFNIQTELQKDGNLETKLNLKPADFPNFSVGTSSI